MTSIKGFPIQGRREDLDSLDINLRPLHATYSPTGANKYSLDVTPFSVYEVSASSTVEANSTDSIIKITGHSAKKGDIIRVLTSANGIQELEMNVLEIPDADTIKLAGVTSENFATGDTISILRPIRNRVSSDGATLASLITPPIQFERDGSNQTVTEDTVTPANNRPLPVKLTDVTGDINITAGDLAVQLSHSGGNYDSVRIGDGTELAAINASNELQVRDDDANTALTSLDGKDFATQTTLAAVDGKLNSLGQKTMTGSVPVAIASDQSVLDIANVSGTISLPTGAATEAKQDSQITELQSLVAKDFATETTLSAINTKMNSLGRKSPAASMPVVLDSDADLQLSGIWTNTSKIAGAVSGAEMQVDVVSSALPTGAATEATLGSIDGKLPASLGQKSKANSFSVTMASDQESIKTAALDVVSTKSVDFSSTNIDSSTWTAIITDTGSTEFKKANIFMSNGTAMKVGIGAAGAEATKFLVFPGGSPDSSLEVTIPANSRVSLQAVVSGETATNGFMHINWLG